LTAALASQSLDDSRHTAAPWMKAFGLVGSLLSPRSRVQQGVREMWNLANNAHSLNVTNNESVRVAKEGIRGGNVALFGLGLHSAGDYLSHASIEGGWTFGHPHGRNEDYSVSHGLSGAADETYRNPQKALATFEQFRSLWTSYVRSNADPNSERRSFDAPAPLNPDQLLQLSGFIYARTTPEMMSALWGGLLQAGVHWREIKEVQEYLADAERRRTAWSEISRSNEGQQAVKRAWSMWDLMGDGKNNRFMNSRGVDIQPNLNDLPAMPVCPRFENERQRNLDAERTEGLQFGLPWQ
jgi:hypothetical protein